MTVRMLGKLDAHLQCETEAVRAFIALLEEEEAALFDADPDRLAAAAQAKLDSARRLADMQVQRLGLRQEQPGTHAQLLRQELAALLRDARQRNECNGIRIRAKLDHVMRAATVLAGTAGAHQTYDPSGLAQSAIRPGSVIMA